MKYEIYQIFDTGYLYDNIKSTMNITSKVFILLNALVHQTSKLSDIKN